MPLRRTSARVVNNRYRPPSPRKWRCPYAASPPQSAGGRTAANCATLATCIRTPSPHSLVHGSASTVSFGDSPEFGSQQLRDAPVQVLDAILVMRWLHSRNNGAVMD